MNATEAPRWHDGRTTDGRLMAPFRYQLAEYVFGQAKWREDKAAQYPEDERNARSAKGLFELDRYIRALPEGDARLMAAEAEYWSLDDDVLSPGQTTANLVSRFRFNVPMETCDALLRRLPGALAQDREEWEREQAIEKERAMQESTTPTRTVETVWLLSVETDGNGSMGWGHYLDDEGTLRKVPLSMGEVRAISSALEDSDHVGYEIGK
jgi:hypothetical protein